MADYWKSIPRKFCEFCKCWLTDNKPSIEFHERGRRHQENVKRKIGELRKKGKKEFTAQRKLNMQMNKINEAAMKAFQKDLIRDPVLVKQLQSSSAFTQRLANPHDQIPSSSTDKQTNELVFPTGKSKHKTAKKAKTWIEGKDDTGKKYYWNSETGDSTWEPPNEGYVSLLEQTVQTAKSVSVTATVTAQESNDETSNLNIKKEASGQWLPISSPTTDSHMVNDHTSNGLVETEASDQWFSTNSSETDTQEVNDHTSTAHIETETYGQWLPVTVKQEEEAVDLQLPERAPSPVQQPTDDVVEVKFKEKTIPCIKAECSSQVMFKKRKLNDVKRNVRKRLDDN